MRWPMVLSRTAWSMLVGYCRSAVWQAVTGHFAIIVDAGQGSLLSYCMDLGLTAGVACRTIHRVCLVIKYSQVGYSLGYLEFCEWGGMVHWA